MPITAAKPRAAKSAPAPRPVKRSPVVAVAGAAIVPKPEDALTIVSGPAASMSPALGKLVTLPIGSIFPSPLNPRRSMSEDALERLGASIIADGQIQPIVVRQRDMGIGVEINGEATPTYEIAAGARRWTSLDRRARRGEIGFDFPIMAVLRELTDTQLVELAATENLGREDMDAIDEALVFDSLRKVYKAEGVAGRPEEEVARRLGINARTVFRRLELLKLDDELQAQVRAKEINLQWAEIIAKTKPEVQSQVLGNIKAGRIDTLDRLKFQIRSAAIPARLALFEIGIYDGPISKDEETGDVFFQDAKLFHQLQTKAVEAKAKAYRDAGIPVVMVRDSLWSPGSYYAGQDGITPAPAKGELPKGAQRAVVLTYSEHQIEVKVFENLMKLPPGKKPTAAQSKAASGEPVFIDPVDEVSTGRRVYAKHAKTRVLQHHLTNPTDPRILYEQLVLALIGYRTMLAIKIDDRGSDNRVVAPAIWELLEPFREKLPGDWSKHHPVELQYTHNLDVEAARQVIAALPLTDLYRAVDALLASRCASYVEYDGAGLGDSAAVIDAATRLKIDMAKAWRIDEPYLATLKTSQLEHLFYATGMTNVSLRGGMMPAAYGKLKVIEKRKAILDFVVANDVRYVPPEMQFADRKSTESAIRKAAKLDAKTGEAA